MPNVRLAIIPAITFMPCIRTVWQWPCWLCYRLSVVTQVLEEDKCHHGFEHLSKKPSCAQQVAGPSSSASAHGSMRPLWRVKVKIEL